MSVSPPSWKSDSFPSILGALMQTCGSGSGQADSPVEDWWPVRREQWRQVPGARENPLLMVRAAWPRRLWSPEAAGREPLAWVTQTQRCWDCSSEQSYKVISMSSLAVCLHRGSLGTSQRVRAYFDFLFQILLYLARVLLSDPKHPKELFLLKESDSFVIGNSAEMIRRWKGKMVQNPLGRCERENPLCYVVTAHASASYGCWADSQCFSFYKSHTQVTHRLHLCQIDTGLHEETSAEANTSRTSTAHSHRPQYPRELGGPPHANGKRMEGDRRGPWLMCLEGLKGGVGTSLSRETWLVFWRWTKDEIEDIVGLNVVNQ